MIWYFQIATSRAITSATFEDLVKEGPLFRQVYLRLRQAILSGALKNGEKLPSTRDLSEQLGVSRTVVLLAYEQLLAEGFAIGRPGSGTYVSVRLANRPTPREAAIKVRLSRFGANAAAAWSRITLQQRKKPVLLYDFAYGRSDLETFPFANWRRVLLRCAAKAPMSELEYGDVAGNPALREAISDHLRRSRSVTCEPDQIIIVNGSQQALDLISRVLIERGDQVVIEDPGYQGAREILRVSGARLLPVSVDRDGINTSNLPRDANVAFVTPSHQFPTGAILPLARRLELLKWARRHHAIIVEDDYDGEFRYHGQPLESLQGLDRDGRVIYVGTFSRTIYPSLRIGYLIAPKQLLPALTAAKWLCDRHTTALEQHALAEFISSGMYERHLRRVRHRNAERRAALLDAVHTYLGAQVDLSGDGAGSHVVLWPKNRISEAVIVDRAASRGVGVYSVSPYWMKTPSRAGILLGYSRMRESEIREGIRRLSEVL